MYHMVPWAQASLSRKMTAWSVQLFCTVCTFIESLKLYICSAIPGQLWQISHNILQPFRFSKPRVSSTKQKKQVCVQLPTSAENVSLPAFAAGCHAVRCGCCWEPGSNRSISPALRAHGSKPIAAACGGQLGQTDGWTNRQRRTPYHYTGWAKKLHTSSNHHINATVQDKMKRISPKYS